MTMMNKLKIIIFLFFLIGCNHIVLAGNELGQSKKLSCSEPFCTYAPPKLSGEVMADTVREIMKNASSIDFYKDKSEKNALLENFISGNQFRFLSPYLIAEHRNNSELNKLFSKSCLIKITEKEYLNKPNGDDSGPFYLYDVKLPHENIKRHAMFVYGLASNPYKDGVIGYFIIFDSVENCTFLHRVSIWGWDYRLRKKPEFIRQEGSRKFVPEFSGFGYFRNQPFLYFFQGIGKNVPVYSFIWYSGVDQLENAKEFKSPSTVINFSDFPKNFNPFNIVNQKLQESNP